MAMVFVVVRLLAVPQALPWQNVSEQEPGLCQLSTEIALGCGVSTLTKALEIVCSALSQQWRIDSSVLMACTHLVTQQSP